MGADDAGRARAAQRAHAPRVPAGRRGRRRQAGLRAPPGSRGSSSARELAVALDPLAGLPDAVRPRGRAGGTRRRLATVGRATCRGRLPRWSGSHRDGPRVPRGHRRRARARGRGVRARAPTTRRRWRRRGRGGSSSGSAGPDVPVTDHRLVWLDVSTGRAHGHVIPQPLRRGAGGRSPDVHPQAPRRATRMTRVGLSVPTTSGDSPHAASPSHEPEPDPDPDPSAPLAAADGRPDPRQPQRRDLPPALR